MAAAAAAATTLVPFPLIDAIVACQFQQLQKSKKITHSQNATCSPRRRWDYWFQSRDSQQASFTNEGEEDLPVPADSKAKKDLAVFLGLINFHSGLAKNKSRLKK